jgi:hypothetical protein
MELAHPNIVFTYIKKKLEVETAKVACPQRIIAFRHQGTEKTQTDKRRKAEKIYIIEYMERCNLEREALNLPFNYWVATYLLDKYM